MAEKNESVRYKYIGFNVFPGKSREFWGNPEEEKKYRHRINEAYERDESFLFNPVLSDVDRGILMASSALLILCIFLPWFGVTFGGQGYSVSVIGFLGILPFIGSLGAWGTGLELPALIVLTIYMLLPPILGIWFLASLAGTRKNHEKYYLRIKRISKLFFIPIILWVVILILASIGFPMLFGNLGIEEIGTSFNLLSFLSIAGIGFYLTLAGCLVCSLMAMEL